MAVNDVEGAVKSSVKATAVANVPKTSAEEKYRLNFLGMPYVAPKEPFIDLGDIDDAPAVIYIVDRSNIAKFVTNKFILTGVQESRAEKTQIIETFGAPSFFFFGEKTKIYNFAGTLLETTDQLSKLIGGKYLWASSITELYENYMRGTKLAENGFEVVLIFKYYKLHGYIINLNIKHDAKMPKMAGFSFSMLVRKQDLLSSGDLASNYNITQLVKTEEEKQELKQNKEDLDKKDAAIEKTKKGFMEGLRKSLNALYPASSYFSTNVDIRYDEMWSWFKDNDGEKNGEAFYLRFYNFTAAEDYKNGIMSAVENLTAEYDLKNIVESRRGIMNNINRILSGLGVIKSK